MYEEGHGVVQNPYWAATLYSRACNSDDPGGCGKLGAAYAEGLGVNQDFSRAKELYSKACDGGDYDGCSNLDDVLRKEHEDEQ